MSDDFQDERHDASRSSIPSADELERQAREALAQIRDRFGDLGGRVRRVVERAGAHWEASASVTPQSTLVPVSAGDRARALARRWADIDFLVDPELAASIAVHALEEAFIWRVELRERGETRLLQERGEPYRGTDPAQIQAQQSVWEYQFPLTPDVASGERRERLPGTGSIAACSVCGGSAHVVCRDCGGQGTQVCPRCHGRARVVCARCHGRGRISAPGTASEKGVDPRHLADHAERLLGEAGERIALLRERLRLDLGVPPPPSRYRAASTDSLADGIPCPECEDGTRPCGCNQGRRACATCAGTGQVECGACKGSGRIVGHREIVRRFDTRTYTRALGASASIDSWVPAEVLARGNGETVWQGPLDHVRSAAMPADVPANVWQAVVTFDTTAVLPPAGAEAGATPSTTAATPERRVIGRSLMLTRLPITRIEYMYASRPYTVVAFGRAGAERFWAESFPHRWSRVGRFLRALSRDLNESSTPAAQPRHPDVAPVDAAPHLSEPAAPTAPSDTPNASKDSPMPDRSS